MGVLMWDKPKKVKSKQEWAEGYGFEDGPTGGYMPNMSDEDNARWKAKITGTKLGFPQVEIRKAAGSQMTIIVNLGEGYNYKHYKAIDEQYHGKTPKDFPNRWWRPGDPESNRYLGLTQKEIDTAARPTKGINVHIALNGPAQMTFEEMDEMHQAIQEAKEALEALAAKA